MSKKELDDNSKVIVSTEYPVDFSSDDYCTFAEFIKQKREDYNDVYHETLSTRDLGDKVGMDYEMFRKVLNLQKPTKKRDCILAICVVLRMMQGEFDETLDRYPHMQMINERDPRDNFIVAQAQCEVTIPELNKLLENRGFDPLDIQDKRDGHNSHSQKPDTPPRYKVKKMAVNTPVSWDYYYDQYNSLSTTYDVFNCRSSGYMILADMKERKYIELISSSDGRHSSMTKDDILPKSYKSLDETGDLKSYFAELDNSVLLEKQRLLDVLNDTRNYRGRTSARLIGDAICVFTEEFNYSIPEMNEYYLLRRSSGKYRLGVYRKSAFMRLYMGDDEYEKYYGADLPEPSDTYDSLEMLDQLISSEDKHSEKAFLYRMRKRAFERLQKNVDDLYEKIKTGKEYIRNLEYIFDNPLEVLPFYDLKDDFECTYDEEYPEITGSLPSKEYTLPDGKKVTVTVDDIERAFILGFDSIKQICDIKSRLGSVDAVLA